MLRFYSLFSQENVLASGWLAVMTTGWQGELWLAPVAGRAEGIGQRIKLISDVFQFGD